jgi:hypothetical protein
MEVSKAHLAVDGCASETHVDLQGKLRQRSESC